MWENTFNFSSGYFPDFILYPCVVKPENNDFDLDYYPEFSDGKYTKQLSNVYSKYDNHYFDRMYPIYRICKKFWKPQEISPSCRKAANSSRIGTKGEDTNTHQSKYPQNKHSSGNSINSNIKYSSNSKDKKKNNSNNCKYINDINNSIKGIVYGKIAKKFYFLFEVLRLYRIKICIKIYMVSLGITP